MPILIRSIRPDELETFADLPGKPDRNADVRAYVARTVESGAMRPGWCYIAEEAGRTVGCVAAWTLPPSDVPRDIVLLEAPWDGSFLEVGEPLVCHVLAEMSALGGERAGYVIDEPPREPFWQFHSEERVRLLERLGFRLARETTRFELLVTEVPPASARLDFRDLTEVGEAAFVDAIRIVSEGTFDQEILEEREAEGPEGAAATMFRLLTRLGYEAAWWQLAHTLDGEFAGLVMPCTNPGAATIGYVGVAPEQRGRGYVDDLLNQITRTLHAAGHRRIVPDTDRENAPMAAAFLRAGYTAFGTRREFTTTLSDRNVLD